MSGVKADTIVAYTYQADILCPSCTIDALYLQVAYLGDPKPVNAEEFLNFLANRWRIDREDETTFDTDEFPKVVFSVQMEEPEECGHCWSTIE